MKDALIGIGAAFALLCCLCAPRTKDSATLQKLFEEIEQRKAQQMLHEQNEQAKKTYEENEAKLNAAK